MLGCLRALRGRSERSHRPGCHRWCRCKYDRACMHHVAQAKCTIDVRTHPTSPPEASQRNTLLALQQVEAVLKQHSLLPPASTPSPITVTPAVLVQQTSSQVTPSAPISTDGAVESADALEAEAKSEVQAGLHPSDFMDEAMDSTFDGRRRSERRRKRRSSRRQLRSREDDLQAPGTANATDSTADGGGSPAERRGRHRSSRRRSRSRHRKSSRRSTSRSRRRAEADEASPDERGDEAADVEEIGDV